MQGVRKNRPSWTASAIENPFESPSVTPEPVTNVYPVPRIVLAAINFEVAVLFAISIVISFIAPKTPRPFFGGILFAKPIAWLAIRKWIVLYHHRASTEREL